MIVHWDHKTSIQETVVLEKIAGDISYTRITNCIQQLKNSDEPVLIFDPLIDFPKFKEVNDKGKALNLLSYLWFGWTQFGPG